MHGSVLFLRRFVTECLRERGRWISLIVRVGMGESHADGTYVRDHTWIIRSTVALLSCRKQDWGVLLLRVFHGSGALQWAESRTE